MIRDFRYIILIGSLYKTLGKVLVDGLRRVLPDVISKTQGAFVVRQKIVDTVLIAHESKIPGIEGAILERPMS